MTMTNIDISANVEAFASYIVSHRRATRSRAYLCNISIQAQRPAESQHKQYNDCLSIRKEPEEGHVFQRRKQCFYNVWNGVANNDTERNHATERECPLCDRDSDQTGLAKAVLHGALERVRARQLAVDDNESDGPVDGDGQTNQEYDTHGQACLTERIRLTDDACYVLQSAASHAGVLSPAPIIELAIFMIAFSLLLFGRALGR
jgi:hypothetical protein